MQVPCSPALWLCRYNVFGGLVALFAQMILEPLPESPVIFIQSGRVGYVFPISQRYPQRRFWVCQVGVDNVPEVTEALGHARLILCPAGVVLERFYFPGALVNVQVCIYFLYGNFGGTVDRIPNFCDIPATLDRYRRVWIPRPHISNSVNVHKISS